jgi:hypothetical protein
VLQSSPEAVEISAAEIISKSAESPALGAESAENQVPATALLSQGSAQLPLESFKSDAALSVENAVPSSDFSKEKSAGGSCSLFFPFPMFSEIAALLLFILCLFGLMELVNVFLNCRETLGPCVLDSRWTRRFFFGSHFLESSQGTFALPKRWLLTRHSSTQVSHNSVECQNRVFDTGWVLGGEVV